MMMMMMILIWQDGEVKQVYRGLPCEVVLETVNALRSSEGTDNQAPLPPKLPHASMYAARTQSGMSLGARFLVLYVLI
jgi:hypothetical protein